MEEQERFWILKWLYIKSLDTNKCTNKQTRIIYIYTFRYRSYPCCLYTYSYRIRCHTCSYIGLYGLMDWTLADYWIRPLIRRICPGMFRIKLGENAPGKSPNPRDKLSYVPGDNWGFVRSKHLSTKPRVRVAGRVQTITADVDYFQRRLLWRLLDRRGWPIHRLRRGYNKD